MKKEPIKLIINEREVEAAVPAGTVTLDFIRQHQTLPGTKEGCREGECGACTVLVGELTDNDVQYKAVASCLLPLGELEGKHLVTVEGINCTAPLLTPIQQALADEGASQCGFCTPGIVLALTGYFISAEKLGCRAAIDAMDGNICRCTGYVPIRRAARKLCSTFTPQLEENKSRIHQMVQWSILPYYFLQIPERLKMLNDEIQARPADSTHPADSGVIVAGGTDLYVQQPEELVDKNLEFISRRKDLAGIKREKNKIVIGAATTTEEMKQSPLVNEFFPNMADYLSLVSSTIMRNRATLAGNIVNASPIGDLTIILLALDARLSLVNRKDKKKRKVPLKKFFKGYKQMDINENEIIEFIKFPVPAEASRFHFEKVSRRKFLDIASCNTAISLTAEGNVIADIHLSTGGVAPIPLYLGKTCKYLKGKEITVETLREAVKVMGSEISPISDVRGSAEYKTLLLRNLFFAHFITLFPGKAFEKVLK